MSSYVRHTAPIASASLVSIETISACGYGLRRQTPYIIPGMMTSDAYVIVPDALAGPSERGVLTPIIE